MTPVGGIYTGTITITPSGGGLSTPIVLTFNASSSPQTFTITPTSPGAVTLTPSNGGGLTNPSSLIYTASGGVTTYLEDTFATGTAGTPLTGNAPHPTANGSDVWGDFVSTTASDRWAMSREWVARPWTSAMPRRRSRRMP